MSINVFTSGRGPNGELRRLCRGCGDILGSKGKRTGVHGRTCDSLAREFGSILAGRGKR